MVNHLREEQTKLMTWSQVVLALVAIGVVLYDTRALLWGIPGMVLAAPISAIFRIVLVPFETTRPIGLPLAAQLPTVNIKEDAP